MPSVDLIDMFLRLAQKYGMKFWFGLYDSGRYWDTGDLSYEIEDNKFVIDEVWESMAANMTVSADGISVGKSVVEQRGQSMRSMLWENSARMCQAGFLPSFPRGLTVRRP